MFRPAWRFGGVEEALARLQHEQVEAIVRNTAPSGWQSAERKLASKLYESEMESKAEQQQELFQKLLRATTGGEPSKSKNQEP